MKFNDSKYCDFLIIGDRIMELAIGYELQKKHPEKKIAIIEKEKDVAMHASGRNSGILHAGFYCTSNSLNVKFTVENSIKQLNLNNS